MNFPTTHLPLEEHHLRGLFGPQDYNKSLFPKKKCKKEDVNKNSRRVQNVSFNFF